MCREAIKEEVVSGSQANIIAKPGKVEKMERDWSKWGHIYHHVQQKSISSNEQNNFNFRSQLKHMHVCFLFFALRIISHMMNVTIIIKLKINLPFSS